MKKANKDIFIWWGAWTSLIVLLTVPYWFNDSDSYLIWGNNWSYLFISIAGVMKAVMDTLQFHFERSVFNKLKPTYFNPEFSWQNKYSDVLAGKRKKFLGMPVFVALTDFWHLVQSFQITFMCLSIITYIPTWHWAIDFVAYSFLYRAFFFLFYKYFLIRRQWNYF